MSVIAGFALVGGVAMASPTYAVALCEGDSWFDCNVTCGGTLIAPNLVVTARHCADTRGAEALDCTSYRFDGPLKPATRIWVTEASPVSNRVVFRGGAAWEIPRNRTCGHDFAVLRLDSAIGGEPANVSRAVQQPDEAVDIYGFGLTAPDAPPNPERRGVNAHLLCAGGRDPCTIVPNANDLLPTELVFDATVCPGDSGSGAFSDGALIGPLSRSVGGTSPCGYGVYVDLAPHLPLLSRTAKSAAAIGHYPVPAWAADAVPLRAFGATCDADADCESGLCRTDDNLAWSCVRACDGGVCFDKPPAPHDGCSAAPARSGDGMSLFFLVLVALRLLRAA